MLIHRRISLIYLYPVVEFSYSDNTTVYKLKKRSSSKRTDRYTLDLVNTKTGKKSKRHFTFDELRNTFVYLRDNVKTSKQPKTNICLTVNCMN